MLLQLRLDTLWEFVDFFVISEATFTQSGRPKSVNFDAERFAKYRAKIRYILVEDAVGGETDYWANENFQRDAIARGLYDAEPHDWILISDLDEIPKPEAIFQFNPMYKRASFYQRYYSYFLNNILVAPKRDLIWYGTKITTYANFEKYFNLSATSVRSYKSAGCLRVVKRWFFNRFCTQKITEGGWHFTWVLSTDQILLKMDAMAHQENNRDEYRDKSYIQRTIQAGRDLIRSDRRYEIVSIDDSFPPALQGSPEHYRPFIRERAIDI